METFIISTWAILLISSIFNSPSTTIVLDNRNGKSNSIILNSKDKKTIIEKPGQYISLNSNLEKIKVGQMAEKEIYSKFKNIIDNEPIKPDSILLYFMRNKPTLTKESKERLDDIVKAIKKRKSSDITVIGHTDTVGSEEKNIKLSYKRASLVKKWIVSKKLHINTLKVSSHGESDLLVETNDNVSEPKNRRVEVLIR